MNRAATTAAVEAPTKRVGLFPVPLAVNVPCALPVAGRVIAVVTAGDLPAVVVEVSTLIPTPPPVEVLVTWPVGDVPPTARLIGPFTTTASVAERFGGNLLLWQV